MCSAAPESRKAKIKPLKPGIKWCTSILAQKQKKNVHNKGEKFLHHQLTGISW